MAVIDLTELPTTVAPNTPLDATRFVASPLELIRKTKFTEEADKLFKLVESRRPSAFIIGLPINMDGTEGARCQSNRAFARNLLRIRPELVIAFWDERLSTMAVNRMLVGEADMTRARRADVVDKMAAAWILQGALDRLRNL
jgi:putative holliday junction resolvase